MTDIDSASIDILRNLITLGKVLEEKEMPKLAAVVDEAYHRIISLQVQVDLCKCGRCEK